MQGGLTEKIIEISKDGERLLQRFTKSVLIEFCKTAFPKERCSKHWRSEAAVRITRRPPRLTRPPISQLNILVFGLRRYQTTQVSGLRRYRDSRLAGRNYTQPQMVLLSGVVCACAIESGGRCPVFVLQSRKTKISPNGLRNRGRIFQIFQAEEENLFDTRE